MRIVALSRGLFAVAAASLGVLALAYGDFAPGGQSLPAWVPLRTTWIHATALLLLLASVGLCWSRTVAASALAVGAYQAIWVLIALPQVLTDPLGIGAWYPICEAVTALIGSWVLYALSHWPAGGRQMPDAVRRSVRLAQILFGLACIFYGASHFAYAAYTAAMVPAWLPGPLAFAHLTGLCHIAAGIGISAGILPRLAATLEALMMSLFGLLVWVPSFFAQPPPKWATPPHDQWSELVVNVVLAASAWIIAASLRERPWLLRARAPRAQPASG